MLRNTTHTVLALGLLAAALLPSGAGAQRWEDLSASRKLGGETAVDVRVRYGMGRFQVRPGDPGTLYRMNLRYDSERFDPLVDYSGQRLELGLEGRGRNLNVRGERDGGEMELELSPGIPMDLVLEFGAVRANLDLGGLNLTDLELSTGASETTLNFSRPTSGRVRTAEFSVGAADFRAQNLGNLRADRLEVEAGVGEVTLSFGGAWPQDMRVNVSMGLGALELQVPEGIGVRLDKESFLTSLEADGFTQEGSTYLSSNWNAAERRLTVEVEAAFGSIRVTRIR